MNKVKFKILPSDMSLLGDPTYNHLLRNDIKRISCQFIHKLELLFSNNVNVVVKGETITKDIYLSESGYNYDFQSLRELRVFVDIIKLKKHVDREKQSFFFDIKLN